MGSDSHLFVEKRNRVTGMWEVIKGRNPDIKMFKERAKRQEEDGKSQEAQRYSQRAKELETGEKLHKELLLLELTYPLLEREKNASLEKEYQSEKKYIYKYESPEVLEGWLYDNRNYDVFGILANVRNGRGFAGVEMETEFIPISEPKDLPFDVSEEVKRESVDWDTDAYNRSYLTLKELLTYDWYGRKTKKNGIVTKEQAKLFRETGETPTIYAAQVFSSEEDYNYEKIEWEVSYYESARDFVDEVIPALKKLVHTSKQDSLFSFLEKLTEEQMESIRIVFWFDN